MSIATTKSSSLLIMNSSVGDVVVRHVVTFLSSKLSACIWLIVRVGSSPIRTDVFQWQNQYIYRSNQSQRSASLFLGFLSTRRQELHQQLKSQIFFQPSKFRWNIHCNSMVGFHGFIHYCDRFLYGWNDSIQLPARINDIRFGTIPVPSRQWFFCSYTFSEQTFEIVCEPCFPSFAKFVFLRGVLFSNSFYSFFEPVQHLFELCSQKRTSLQRYRVYLLRHIWPLALCSI